MVSLAVILFCSAIKATFNAGQNSENRQSLPRSSAHSLLAHPTGNDTRGMESRTRNAANKPIEEQQETSLEKEGGRFEHKSVAVFLPRLFPLGDRKIVTAFVVRFIVVFAKRALNVLTPRQLGVIVDELRGDTIPWRAIGLWSLSRWLDSVAGLDFINSMAANEINQQAAQNIRLLAYEHVLTLSTDFHADKDSGEVSKAVEEASSLVSLIEIAGFQIAPTVLDLVIAVYYITYEFDAHMTLLFSCMGIASILAEWLNTARVRPKRRAHANERLKESAMVLESFRNYATIANFHRFDYQQSRYESTIKSRSHMSRDLTLHVSIDQAVQSAVQLLGETACYIVIIFQVIARQKEVGAFVMLMTYWPTVMSPLNMLRYNYASVSKILTDCERVRQLFNTKPSVADAADAKALLVDKGVVEFGDVSFAYPKRESVLRNVSARAEGGQTVALVGTTGSGKSTMLTLLLRLYDVDAGFIQIDGQDLRSVTQSSIRNAIGVVPQKAALFKDTIRQNVRYGRLEATDKEIEDACRAAAIHDDIIGFQDGYDTEVGEGGFRLSGGQLQRIAIAQVLLKNPKIFILDEATSAVDTVTEAYIQQAFRKLTHGHTTFIVAHRLSSTIHADQILVIEKGQIVESGNHQELLKKDGLYSELWTKQSVARAPPECSEEKLDRNQLDVVGQGMILK